MATCYLVLIISYKRDFVFTRMITRKIINHAREKLVNFRFKFLFYVQGR